MERTRSRVDAAEGHLIGYSAESWRANEGTSMRWFPKYGPWELPGSGLSGHNFVNDPAARAAVKQYMLEHWKQFAQHDVSSNSVAAGYSLYGRSDITDVSTKNFRALSRGGAIFNNPYSRTRFYFEASTRLSESETNPEGHSYPQEDWKPNSIGIYIHSCYQSRESAWMALPEDVIKYILAVKPEIEGRQTAINNAFGNMQQGEVEILTIALESKKTITHLVSVVTRFAALVKALKTGHFEKLAPKTFKNWKQGLYGKAASAADCFSDAWMEARYAWVPLIYDAIGATKILTGNVEKRLTYRGKEVQDVYIDVDTQVACGPINVGLKAVVYGNAGCRAGVLTRARMDPGIIHQSGVFNMATAIKEIIPYSFVLEWFVDLSGLLYHLNPNPVLEPLAAWSTDFYELRSYGTVSWVAPSGENLEILFKGSHTHKMRTPIDGPGTLTIDVNLNVSRLIDGAILLLRFLR